MSWCPMTGYITCPRELARAKRRGLEERHHPDSATSAADSASPFRGIPRRRSTELSAAPPHRRLSRPTGDAPLFRFAGGICPAGRNRRLLSWSYPDAHLRGRDLQPCLGPALQACHHSRGYGVAASKHALLQLRRAGRRRYHRWLRTATASRRGFDVPGPQRAGVGSMIFRYCYFLRET